MAISDGMSYGWTSPMVPYFKGNYTHLSITDQDAEWMETVIMLGAMAGLPFTIIGVNFLGRKKCMIISSIVACLCWIGILVATSLGVILTARFFSGMAGDMCFVAAPMYIAEIADHRIRGFLSGSIYLMMLVGIITVYTAGSLAPYYVVPIIGISLTSCQAIIFPFVPESPYYLVYINRSEEAKKSLTRLRGANAHIDDELLEIQKAVERQKAERGRLQDLLLIKSNRKALFIMLVLNSSQHFVGISVILMNLHEILNEAGSVYISSSTASIIFAAIMLCAASIASVVVDKLGRKLLLMTSSFLTAISLLAIAIYFILKNSGYDVVFVSWIPAVSVMVYAATFKMGLGLVPIVMTAEIFPTTVKAMGMTIADCIYVIASVVSVTLYSVLYQKYGMHIPFYFFGMWSFLAVFIVYISVPETKGKTLEEIQLMLKGIKS